MYTEEQVSFVNSMWGKDNRLATKTAKVKERDFPDLWDSLFTSTGVPKEDHKTALYMVKNGVHGFPNCKVCNKQISEVRHSTYGFEETCSRSCAAKSGAALQKQEFLDGKRQYASTNQDPEVKKRKSEALERRYGIAGATSPFSIPSVRKDAVEAIIETNMKRYGVHTTLLVPSVRAKIVEAYSNSPVVFVNRSNPEKDLGDFLIDLGYTIKTNDRTVLVDQLELDILIPDKNVAVEINGAYYHSHLPSKSNEKYKTNTGRETNRINRLSHWEKYNGCLSKGIQLLQFTDLQIQDVRTAPIVKSMILAKLGHPRSKLGARECEVCIPSADEVFSFYEANHIQGATRAGIHFGLTYANELVSCASFIPSGNISERYELVRYASKIDLVVSGGFGRLLKAFSLEYNPSSIQTFLDLQYGWERSNIYLPNDFTEEARIQIDYKKFYKNNLVNKRNLRKDALEKLGAVGETESEMDESLGIKRFWDCGKIRYVKTYTKETACH